MYESITTTEEALEDLQFMMVALLTMLILRLIQVGILVFFLAEAT